MLLFSFSFAFVLLVVVVVVVEFEAEVEVEIDLQRRGLSSVDLAFGFGWFNRFAWGPAKKFKCLPACISQAQVTLCATNWNGESW